MSAALQHGSGLATGLESDHFVSSLYGQPVEVDQQGDVGGRTTQAEEGEVPHDAGSGDDADQEEEDGGAPEDGDNLAARRGSRLTQVPRSGDAAGSIRQA